MTKRWSSTRSQDGTKRAASKRARRASHFLTLLELTYAELLEEPYGSLDRIGADTQHLMAHLVDMIARRTGKDSEEVQNAFEQQFRPRL